PLNGGELGRVVIENKPRVVEAVLAVEQQSAVHGPLVLGPVVLVRCGLASGSRNARRRARTARAADLVVAVEEERGAGPARPLVVQLEILIVQNGQVRFEIVDLG